MVNIPYLSESVPHRARNIKDQISSIKPKVPLTDPNSDVFTLYISDNAKLCMPLVNTMRQIIANDWYRKA